VSAFGLIWTAVTCYKNGFVDTVIIPTSVCSDDLYVAIALNSNVGGGTGNCGPLVVGIGMKKGAGVVDH
jgi:hypothetical protein